MSPIKGKEFRGLSDIELDQKRETLEGELRDLRQKKVTGQLDKPHLFKAARRQIAQINTVRTERQNANTSKQK